MTVSSHLMCFLCYLSWKFLIFLKLFLELFYPKCRQRSHRRAQGCEAQKSEGDTVTRTRDRKPKTAGEQTDRRGRQCGGRPREGGAVRVRGSSTRAGRGPGSGGGPRRHAQRAHHRPAHSKPVIAFTSVAHTFSHTRGVHSFSAQVQGDGAVKDTGDRSPGGRSPWGRALGPVRTAQSSQAEHTQRRRGAGSPLPGTPAAPRPLRGPR